MSRLSSTLVVVSLAVGLPAQAQQPAARVLEIGVTGGVSHHDFHYRYPGEGRWQDPFGVRLDARFRAGSKSAVGVALVADRYVYSVASGVCLSDCVPSILAGPDGPNTVRFSTAWQVSRLGLAATGQQQLFGPLHGNVGILSGRSWRQTLDDAPLNGPLPATTQEWFVGGEAGITAHWRDLALGLGGEYGRVPRTYYALRPYYGRIVARVAYRTAW
jgi:hypothetical protein